MNFTGADNTRDSYLGTDSAGTPVWYRDNGATSLTLNNGQIYASHQVKVNGELEATSLDINGPATFDTNVNSGGFIDHKNSNASSAA